MKIFPKAKNWLISSLTKDISHNPGKSPFLERIPIRPSKTRKREYCQFPDFFHWTSQRSETRGLLKRTSARIIESGKPLPMPFPGKSLLARLYCPFPVRGIVLSFAAGSPCSSGQPIKISPSIWMPSLSEDSFSFKVGHGPHTSFSFSS